MQQNQLQEFKEYLSPRDHAANKGDFGHVLVVGGDHGMAGAPRMTAEAAARVGAGLVSVATHPEHLDIINVGRPELMCHSLNKKNLSSDLKSLITKATVIAIGPGLGKSDWSQAILKIILAVDRPLVVDADALNLLAENSQHKNNWILTPHPGEAARLLNSKVDEIQKDRNAAIQELQKKYGGTIVLKGPNTLVLGKSTKLFKCMAGNPGMASGGMGDVLTGVIAGLVAQSIPLEDAAKLGVLIHAQAGDSAAIDGQRGLLAMDLMPYIRRLAN